jgi:hypothetical protein
MRIPGNVNSRGVDLNMNLKSAAGEDKRSPLFLFLVEFANR